MDTAPQTNGEPAISAEHLMRRFGSAGGKHAVSAQIQQRAQQREIFRVVINQQDALRAAAGSSGIHAHRWECYRHD